jgi:hypothetical protein
MSSTTTVTSLPLRAASTRISISSESVPVRYTVCLMAITFGIVRGGADELDHRQERLERVMQQDVVLLRRFEEIAAAEASPACRAGTAGT